MFQKTFRYLFRKSVVSIKFPPVILGPEMAAPILWAPGIFGFFLLDNPHAHKIPPFRGGFWVFLGGGGGSANFIFMGVGIFPTCGVFTRYFFVAFSWFFRRGQAEHTKASSRAPKPLVYTRGHHVGVSPGEDTDSEWGLAPKKKSSEDCGLAGKDLVPGVSSEDWVEGG